MTIGVEILIKFGAFINNVLLLMIDTFVVDTLIVFPVNVENPIVFAVNPLVVALNVLIVDPDAVEKYKFDATKLFAT